MSEKRSVDHSDRGPITGSMQDMEISLWIFVFDRMGYAGRDQGVPNSCRLKYGNPQSRSWKQSPLPQTAGDCNKRYAKQSIQVSM